MHGFSRISAVAAAIEPRGFASSSELRRLNVLRRHVVGSGCVLKINARSLTTSNAFNRGEEGNSRPFKLSKVLVANRGEIAVRVIRACAELNLRTVAVFEPDDLDALHVIYADESVALPMGGYLDPVLLAKICADTGADAVHPGYGFLSEDPALPIALAKYAPQTRFVGPSSKALTTFGDKLSARAAASSVGLPILGGSASDGAVSNISQALDIMRTTNLSFPIMLKPRSGGGGRGMVRCLDEAGLKQAFAGLQMNATIPQTGIFFVEKLVENAFHVEVQVIGDGTGAILHLGDRNCSLQTALHQKVLEIAPASSCLPHETRLALIRNAVKLMSSEKFKGAGTVEFLVDAASNGLNSKQEFWFLEVNPRLQVEHTVTEESQGVDIVEIQLCIAQGASLADLRQRNILSKVPESYFAGCPAEADLVRIDEPGAVSPMISVQARVCLKAPGLIRAFSEPSGKGIRVDSALRQGIQPSVRFDPLIAKVICTGETLSTALSRLQRGLRDFHIDGLETNVHELYQLTSWLVDNPDLTKVTTTFLETNGQQLRKLPVPDCSRLLVAPDHAEAQALEDKPLADAYPDGTVTVQSPSQASVSEILKRPGDTVNVNDRLFVLTFMKMDTVVTSAHSGVVSNILAKKGSIVAAGEIIMWLDPSAAGGDDQLDAPTADSFQDESSRKDREIAAQRTERLRALREEAVTMGGPEAVQKHHAKGRLTVRERVSLLLDPESFDEVGRSAKGNFVLGTGTLNGGRSVVVAGEDFTQSGGSPTLVGLRKSVYTESLALRLRVPLVRLHEGGGGSVAGAGGGKKEAASPAPDAVFQRPRFESVAQVLSLVPVASAALGPVAGLPASRLVASHFSVMVPNAQVIIAGPAVVKRAIGEEYTKEELGGPQVHLYSGVVDNLAEDEKDAMKQIRQFLSYLPDNIALVPPVLPSKDDRSVLSNGDSELDSMVSAQHRRQIYDIRDISRRIFDQETVFEQAPHFGPGIVTMLARLGGYPVGVVANDCAFYGGAMTADGAKKLSRFIDTMKQFSLPVVFLVDEPGFWIGRMAEQLGTIRWGTEAVLKTATFPLPAASVVLRKSFGVAAAAHFPPDCYTLIWPTAEMGALPVESGVAVAFRRQLESISDERERDRKQQELEDMFSQRLDPFPRAQAFGAHEIINPSETRDFLLSWIKREWPLVEHHVRTK